MPDDARFAADSPGDTERVECVNCGADVWTNGWGVIVHHSDGKRMCFGGRRGIKTWAESPFLPGGLSDEARQVLTEGSGPTFRHPAETQDYGGREERT